MSKPMSLRSEKAFAPCDEDRPHTRNCAVCRKDSERIHGAAEQVRTMIENAADLVIMAIQNEDEAERSGVPLIGSERRSSVLLNAATIVLSAANTALGMDIIDETFSPRQARSASIGDGRSFMADCLCQDRPAPALVSAEARS